MSRDGRGLLDGRRILVTGAGSGIGLAIAQRCVVEGARVALMGRTRAKLDAAAATTGGSPIVGDVTDEASVRAAVAAATAALGGLDGLVNAAGATWTRPTVETSLQTWNEMLAVHMTGTFLVCREAAGILRRSPDAAIVNVSSVAGLLPGLSGSAYAAAKGGQIVFSKALAVELAPQVRVNILCPGPTETTLSRPQYDAMAQAGEFEAFLAKFPLGRIAGAEEIARVACFLVSADAAYVTGAVWTADGGRSLH
jgi:NAD(P)-dependent dehydrogenase (short-subunit alcohol dehydrogenase family)